MGPQGLQVDKRVGIEYREGAVSRCREEVAGEGQVLWRVELESCDRGRVVVKGAKGSCGGEVVDVDGVIATPRSRDGAGGGDRGDGGEMGGVGEQAS